jgi:hypothetical protein
LAHALHRAERLSAVLGEAMNRPIVRLATAVLGGLAVVSAMAALVLVASVGGRQSPLGPGAAIPLLAGGFVALLAWYLLADVGRDEGRDATRATATCPSCGSELFEEWRLCPYCGGSREPASREPSVAGVAADLRESRNNPV